ncbi:MAG: type I polyketide synthase, partial [Acidobacteriaceae bacterium]
RACAHTSPGPGEIRISITEAGLNFSDVTKVMGLYPGLIPGQSIPLGNEAVGQVTAVGEGVERFRIGDQVIALTPGMQTVGMMASSATIPAELAVHKPACLSDEQAATVAIVYVTAYWSLIDQARLRKGEWVLIHAGAGGVGVAAIEIAKWIGANIIVTVGSPEKQEYMRSLGVQHVLHSRSLSFAAGVMEITQGRGVDVVLNSLAGEFLLKSMDVLAPYGRFIELGKRDVHGDSRVGLRALRNNGSFHVVDVAAGVEDRRPYIAELLAEVMSHIGAGDWAPPPVTSFPSTNPADPFRFMAQARHIGKISIRMDRDVQVLPARERKLFSSTAAYLITGGLGGVALRIAEWMAQNGAGHIVLLSRRASSPETDAVIHRMEDAGATVVHARADVTRKEEIEKLIETLHARGIPLKGILHTAAVVDDVLIRDITPERFLPVMAPKIAGAWNLYETTKQEELDFFVLFSSIAALHPQPGMGSYAAANAFLDAFAHFLRAHDIPAISVNWGAWDQIGLARAEGTGKSLEGYASQGLRNFSGEEALSALQEALEAMPVQVLAVPLDRERFATFHGPNDIPPIFADLVARTQGSDAESHHSEILNQLSHADASDRRETLEDYLQETLGRVLKLAAHRIDRERALGSMGLDSLMGLEFVRRLSNALEIAVPATVVFNYPTIHLLATHLLRRMQLDPVEDSSLTAGSSAAAVVLDGRDNAVADLAGELSEEDALQALMGSGQRSS